MNKNSKFTTIDELTELIPGMLIAHKNKKDNIFRIVFAEAYRDALAVCLNDCGHTVLVPAWDGDHGIILDGCEKVRIAYGKTPGGVIKVTDNYYYSVDDFKKTFPQSHFWYVEELRGTRKFIVETPVLGFERKKKNAKRKKVD